MVSLDLDRAEVNSVLGSPLGGTYDMSRRHFSINYPTLYDPLHWECEVKRAVLTFLNISNQISLDIRTIFKLN